ncbi:hypothetical protein BDQ94DRAFT_155220 [Aspergillus welwitschiae]|uniref:Uncharacterized protein n=1 Tax=Aspergillus welwitschiae TaxID=1341132 RepID=A0A3F3PI70_9EURO|nr:hypothetical protein BDQ94DRAFT_155220 [Aspergillus welwitschiae]RDH26629.1 hypothetical protein BDQ94DRAFT_155220 [Aspergillus welwitschiae]
MSGPVRAIFWTITITLKLCLTQCNCRANLDFSSRVVWGKDELPGLVQVHLFLLV